MATLFLIVCVAAADPSTCRRIPIGTDGLTMSACKSVAGQSIAQMHWQTFYLDQEFGGWECVPMTVPESAA